MKILILSTIHLISYISLVRQLHFCGGLIHKYTDSWDRLVTQMLNYSDRKVAVRLHC